MRSIRTKSFQAVAYCVALGFLAASIHVFAQDQPPAPAPSPGWHTFSNPPQSQGYYPPPQDQGPNYPPAQAVPPQLRLQAGTFVTVRVDQMLSTDKNHAGDGFSATLARPLIADGVVVAERGQMIGGRVTEVQKAGRVKGVSRLGVQLTDLTLVDGQQVPIETEFANMTGPTSKGRDAGAIAGTTAVGAAIGGAADFGPGAAIGAGAGLFAGTVGVLLTRGRPSAIYPESLLTFRLAAPVAISTVHAPQAFRFVSGNEYTRAAAAPQAPPPQSGWTCRPPCPLPPSAPYAYPYYPYPYGFGVGLWYGPGFYYGRGYYGHYHR